MMQVFNGGVTDVLQYCCSHMATFRDFNEIKYKDGKFWMGKLMLYRVNYCPFCGSKIDYLERESTQNDIDDSL
jgi:hypothetical protein